MLSKVSWQRIVGVAVIAGLSWPSLAAAEDHGAARDDAILADLASSSPVVRRRAARRIVEEELVSPRVGAALVSAARTEDDRHVYVDMLCALGSTNDDAAGPLLEQHLRSPDDELARCALRGLRRWRRHRGLDVPPPRWRGRDRQVAEGFHVVSRDDPTLGYAGLGLMAGGHAIMAVTSTVVMTTEPGSGTAAWGLGLIPVVGPVFTGVGLAFSSPSADGPNVAGREVGYVVPLVASGAIQIAGLVMTIVAFEPGDVVERDHIALPAIEIGPGSAQLRWSF